MLRITYREETRLQGLPVSGGVALARVCLFNEGRHNNLPMSRVEADGVEREAGRLKHAVELAVAQLDALREAVTQRIGAAEAGIFSAQVAILQDPDLHGKMEAALRESRGTAEAAVITVMEAFESRLMEVDNAYIKDRASDIGELKRRLLDHLGNLNISLQCEGFAHCQRGRDRIVVAVELTPSLTLELDTSGIRGFVTERGGKTAHAAILARALGIPAVTGIKGIHQALSCGTELLINGHTGEVIVWPTEATVASHRGDLAPAQVLETTSPVPDFKVMANISRLTDAETAATLQAEGIGLYRTEFEFMAAGRLLNEDEQLQRYAEVIATQRGQPVTIRLLDVGGDKATPYFEIPEEDNPYLGFRGSRYLLARPDLLGTQARAIARASAFGPVQVLYPMIIDVEQFLALKQAFLRAIRDLPPMRLSHGIMFEVPSACLLARELLDVADFASVGTNDLIQYLFAVDRNNDRVSYDFSPDRTVFWDLLSTLAEAAQAKDKPLSVCGEMAGDPHYTGRLIDLGIRTVSVSPKLIPRVRQAALRHRGG